MPDYYLPIRAARYLGVNARELVQWGDADVWIHWALTAEAAETEARNGPVTVEGTGAAEDSNALDARPEPQMVRA